ncbi:MAG TPA: GAF domain-containing protein, partial [Methylomirabilota bacterium]|nr:GAF domain-containing protein [Methylomirabilota bacterium]
MKGKKKPAQRRARPATNVATPHRLLEQRLAEALRQQAATAEILRVISSSPDDARPAFQAIVESAARLCEAEFSAVAQLSDGLLHLTALNNMSPAETAAYHSLFPRAPHRGFILGRAFVDARPVHVEDVQQDPDYERRTLEVLQHAAPYRTFLGIPILRHGVPVGAIGCGRREVKPFTPSQIELVKTFADQAVIAIENVRLFAEAQAKNRDLAESLEQQTATSEILSVISSSPTDIQPVLDAMARSAVRLSGAFDVTIYLRRGDILHLAAHHGPIPAQPTLPLVRGTSNGRAVLTGRIIHVLDMQAESADFPEGSKNARLLGHRTILCIPMLREGVAIGTLHVRRTEAQLFSARQVALLETFARQAVIAIENVRLFTEAQEKNRALSESLEQQTATSEILRVISGSPTDVKPVFNTIARSARRLCGAEFCQVFQVESGQIHNVGNDGQNAEGLAAIRATFPRPVTRDTAAGRAILTAAVSEIPDVQADPDYPATMRAVVQTVGFRSLVAVPILRDGVPIGAIAVGRAQTGHFPERQIELLKTFAEQAVIAIENVRLFQELEIRNRDLTGALERQTATSEVLKVISRSAFDLQPVLATVVESATRLCHASRGHIFRFDGTVLRFAAAFGATPEFEDFLVQHPTVLGRGSVAGRAGLERRTIHVEDVLADPEYQMGGLVRQQEYRTVLGVPMLREGALLGVIAILKSKVEPFTQAQVELVTTFADQAVIAIENVRLFQELEVRNCDLTETLEQQTATGEILRVISRSPTDVHPVFDTIVERAHRLCDADSAALFTYDGALVHLATLDQTSSEQARALREAYPMPATRGHATGRAILDSRPVHIPDIREDPSYGLDRLRDSVGLRTLLSVPMMRDGVPTGAITVQRWGTPRPFSDKQVALLETFAEQAVIAIENVRLFKELEVRNRDLIETLEQQTATSEILRVISSSPTDVQPVFDSIAASAKRLCEAEFCFVFRLDGQVLHFAAQHGLSPEGNAAMHTIWPAEIGRGSAAGRSILDRAVVHIPDVRTDPEYRQGTVAEIANFRSVLGVPMLRDGVPIGTMTVNRSQAGPFPERQVELLKTFADQAVIAIENVRLFKELEVRNRDLTVTLEQQTATGEILRVISSSPTDVQPVFDTIAQSAKRLCEAEFCHIFRFDGTLLHFVGHHGLASEGVEAIRRAYPLPPGRASAAARAVLSGRVEQIPDVDADPDYAHGAIARLVTYRSIVAVPLLQDGRAIGAIAVARSAVGLFPERQLDLLKTFADQAVIAIQNVRLFQELDARTQDLTRSVGELKALGEVSQAVSSTLDLDAVLATIVSHAVQLSGSYSGIIYEYEEASETFHVRATHQITPAYLEVLRAAPIRLGDGAIGTAAVIQKPVQVADIQDERQLVAQQSRAHLVREGLRSLLAMPLIRENRLLGGLVVLRREKGAFALEVLATMQTFATQSVLAIQNARLFVEIQRQKQYSDVLVQSSPVAIATMDLQGMVVGWNPGAERLFGYTQAEAVGRPMEDLVATPESRAAVRANIEQTLAGEWIRDITRRVRKDGSAVDVEISSVPVVVEGQRVGMIGIYHDITELLQARREAEAANEAKSAFLATMSHEIRTPMNAVIGMSGLLLNTALNDEQREYAEIVRQSGDTLLTVINDILDFSKIEAGRLELETQPFDLRECVEGALDLMATRAADKGLDLAYLLADGTPAAIVGDVTRLRQVLLNLLSNAVKFTERGEVVLSVFASRLEGASDLHEVTFTVRDTGIGIPTDRLGRLFQSFSQVDASTTRRYGGTGLGLAISQRLTELMGGQITVKSEMGVGSEFRFAIRAAAAVAPVPARRDLTGVQPSLRGKRVLAVDDNATNRRILASHLETWGMLVRVTDSPREGLGWVRGGERFDLGILDMHMPEMDGVA